MTNAEKHGTLDEQHQSDPKPQPSRSSQMITALKLFTVAGGVMLALWMIDQAVTR